MFFLGLYSRGIDLYRCTQCGLSFDSQRTYSFHFAKPPHKADIPYRCKDCPAGRPEFRTQDSYLSHIMSYHQEPRLEGPAQYGKSNTHVIHHIPIIQTKQLVSGSSPSNIGLTRRLRPQMFQTVPHSSINPQAWPISNPTAFTNLGSPFNYADKNEQTVDAIITESPLGIYNYDSRGFLIPFPTSYQQHYLNYLDNSRNLQNVGLFTRPSSLDRESAILHPSRDMMEAHSLWDRTRLIDFDDSRREATTISSDASTTSSDTTQYRCRRSQEHLCEPLVDSDDHDNSTAHKADEKVQNVQGFRCIFPNLPLNTRSRKILF